MKFNEKTVLCNTEDAHRVIRETELQWIAALLSRLKLDSAKINAIMSESNEYGSQLWREYLTIEQSINVIRHPSQTIIEKHFEEKPKVLLGKWEKPEIVRVREGANYHIELRLKYWQLI